MPPDAIALAEAKRHLLERYLQSRPEPGRACPQPIPRRDPRDPVPLTYEQEQVWLHAQMAPEAPLYNEPVTIIYRGPFDAAAFERSFNEILRRHEAWRSSVHVREGRPEQVVHPALSVSLPVLDLRQLPSDERLAEAARVATEDATRPLDLSRPPLFRARLIRLDDEEHRLYLILSHIIFDGVAIYRVLLPELAALYKAYAANQPSPLPEPAVQYPDYACWQRRSVPTQERARDVAYWRRQLAGELPLLSLPSDRPPPAALRFRGAMYPFVVSNRLLTALSGLSRDAGTTLFQTLLASFAVLLSRYSGQPDVPIGSTTAGRGTPGTESMLGYFLNTVVLRMDLSGDPSFRELVARARSVTIEALEHDGVPFGELVKELKIQRDLSRNPLFQVMLTLEPPLAKLDPAWDLTQAAVDTGATKVDLYFELDERPDRLLARFHYSTDLFDAPTIARMAEHWTTLLEAAVRDPGRRVSALPLLSEREEAELAAWNRTAHPYSATMVHELFEAQAARSPESAAVVFEGRWLSYRELNARANQLARHLRTRGVQREVLVGLCVERSLEMVIALLGILKAGGAYVPLDPTHPRERLQAVVSDAQPRLIVTQQPLGGRLPEAPDRVLLDAERDAIACESPDDLGTEAGPANLAYVMYTSGSAGAPKGVQIEHRAVVNFLCSMQRDPGIGPRDVVLAVTTLSFDIAALEIYLPLVSGARVVIAPWETACDGARLLALLEETQATLMQATPVTWRMLIEAGWRGAPALTILCGGETLLPELARELFERGRAVWNLYGPTEATIWSAAHRLTGQEDRFVPIGQPIANTQIYVLDSDMNPVPAGAAGQLYIGGDGLARGYLQRPELTGGSFVPDPFGAPGARLYKTGDLARRHPDGRIEFLGRTDNQVKVRGFRIELGAIEAALAEHPAVETTAAAVHQHKPGDRFLVAYVAFKHKGPAATAEELRDFLKQKLPEYMLPAAFVFLDAFPLTPSGKLDRRALPGPDRSVRSLGEAFVSPRNGVEAQLALIWEKLLGIERVGVRDDFFELGGHSLLAMRLFTGVEEAFGRKLPLATLIKAPTIEQLAEVLREEARAGEGSVVVPLQPRGFLPPLFCVHGHMGEVLFYRPLSRRLGPEQPFFALQARGREGSPAYDSVCAMAADYVTEIRRVQPDGPYFLAGFCFGAKVAFEMARQLVARGERVAFLGLLLAYEPRTSVSAQLSSKVLLHREQFRRMGARAKLKEVAKSAEEKLALLTWRLKYRLVGRRLPSSSALRRNVPAMHLEAARRYVPRPYPGQMTVFLSGPVPGGFRLDPETDLGGMDAHTIELRIVPGDERSMLREPFVDALAEPLRACLATARSETSPAHANSRAPARQGRNVRASHGRATKS